MATSTTPAACQPIATRLEQEQGVVKSLQLRLQRASPTEKPKLVTLIGNRQAVVAALNEQLRACVLAHPPQPPQPPDLFEQQRMLPIVSLVVGLGGVLEGMTVRFHNQGSGDHRHSSVDIRVRGQSRSGYPKDLGQLTSSWADLHLNDINSQSLSVHFDAAANLPLRLRALFETQGTEIIVNNLPDKDLTLLSIQLDLTLGVDVATALLTLLPGPVQTKALVKGLLLGTHEDKAIEAAFNAKVAQALGQGGLVSNLELTRQVLGTGWDPAHDKVRAVRREGESWRIDFARRRPVIVF